MKLHHPFLLLALLALPACGEEIPENPTWHGEVETILVANCGRCHGETKAPGAPDMMRLDQYDGAAAVAGSILTRAVDYEEIGVPQMPPDSYLSFDQKDILRLWIENGTPLGTPE